jgi:hypothetical protein
MAAVEMEADNYDYAKEQEKSMAQSLAKRAAGVGMNAPPQGRFGRNGGEQANEDGDNNPIHGKGKEKIKDQHKNL